MRSRWWIFIIAGFSFLIRFYNLTDVLVGGHLYFVDADCYSRMTRVQMISASPGTVIHFQHFENWPEGVASHATAPLDYLIVGFERLLRPCWPKTGRFGVLADQTLDVAGALISPILGTLLCLLVGVWAHGIKTRMGDPMRGWWMAPLLIAISPAMAHATVFGRPDHQSLIVLLVGAGLAVEQRMNGEIKRLWAVLGGMAWGFALWVSLFEPLILLGGCVLFAVLFSLHSWRTLRRLEWAVGLLLVLFLAYRVEGLPVSLPNKGDEASFLRWGATIGELHSLTDFGALPGWLSGLIWLAPLALWWGYRRNRMEEQTWIKIAIGLTAVCFFLTVWMIRWAPYLVLVFAFLTPWILVVTPRRWIGGIAAALSLWPVADLWEQRIYRDPDAEMEHHLDRSERINARLAAERMRSTEMLPFIASWWLSPSLAYWSGQPAVAGSGHEGIAGIMDTARFFLSTDLNEAREILERRGVKLVVASDSARSVKNSEDILGVHVSGKPLAERLWEPDLPADWGMTGESNVTTFRLIKVLPVGSQKAPASSPVE